MKRVLGILLSLLLLASVVLPVLPTRAEGGTALAYPTLDSKVQYFETTFPSGLRYSPRWYGTFTYAPAVETVLLFDDSVNGGEWGRAIFSMPVGWAPSGAQGGTSLRTLTLSEADAIIKSYSLDAAFKPFDAEIEAIMKSDHFFNGVWAGDKLAQKWRNGATAERAPPTLTTRQQEYLRDTAGQVLKQVDLTKYDPDRYFIGPAGNSNWTNTATWSSTADGLTTPASVPTNADNVYPATTIQAGATLTVDAAASCLDMDWTGAVNSPTLAGTEGLNIYGSATFIAVMTLTYTGNPTFAAVATGKTITMNGIAWGASVYFNGNGGGWTLQDDFSVGGNTINLYRTTLNTNGKTVTCNTFRTQGAAAKTLTLGSSIVNCTEWDMVSGGGIATLTANTSTIKVSSTGAFVGGGIATYNELQLLGSAHTISGSNTFAALTLPAGTTQTITFTDGTDQTVTTATLSGSAGNVHTLQGSGVGGWKISQGAGTVTADFISISRSTAEGGATFNAVGSSVNGGNNVGWNFPLTVSTQAATAVTMNKDGVTGGLFHGTLTDMGGANGTRWFEYGLTAPAYGTDTAHVAYTAPVVFSAAIPATLTPGAAYHYRSVMNNGVATSTGADQTFTFTQPTVATGTSSLAGPTVTLWGNIGAMGVASNTYVYFLYGATPAYGSVTAPVTQAGIGAFNATVAAPGADTTLYFRAVSRNGAVLVLGAGSSIPVPSATGGMLLVTLLRLLVAVGIIIGVIRTAGLGTKTIYAAVVGLIAYAIIDSILRQVF